MNNPPCVLCLRLSEPQEAAASCCWCAAEAVSSCSWRLAVAAVVEQQAKPSTLCTMSEEVAQRGELPALSCSKQW